MNLRHLALAVSCCAILACPKNVPVNLAGSDDERMDQYSAELDELSSRAGNEANCKERCTLMDKACRVSKGVCEISGRTADREDFAKKCSVAQEECARWTDGCQSCR